MKFYEFILKLQELNPRKIVMVSSGVFFNSVGKDAIVLEHLLGFKRTCFAKGLCRVGMPVTYVRENMEEVKKRLKAKNISVIIYDEIKGGRYKFENKEYDVLFELEGNDIKEERKCLNCKECDNNIYSKNTNTYTIVDCVIPQIVHNLFIVKFLSLQSCKIRVLIAVLNNIISP